MSKFTPHKLKKERRERALLNLGIKPTFYPWLLGILSLLIGINYSVLDWPTFWQFQDGYLKGLAISFLIGAFTFFAVKWLNKVIVAYACMPEILYEVTHLSPSKWIGMDNDKSLETVYKQLINLEEKRLFAFKFAIESLQQIINKGFIIFETDVSKYVDYLIYGVESSSKCVFSTCLVRPYWFLRNSQEHTYGEIPDSIGGYKTRSQHLIPFRDFGRVGAKYRILLFEDIDDAKLILQDTLLNCKFEPHSDEVESNYWELPEVQWFIEEVNRSPNIKLYWSTKKEHEDWLRKSEDFMLFDKEVLMQFKFINEDLGKGHLFLRWDGNFFEEDNKEVMENIDNLMKVIEEEVHNQTTSKGWSGLSPIGQTHIYRSYRELLRAAKLEPSAFQIQTEEIDSITSDHIADVNAFIESFNNFDKFYSAILEKLNNNEWHYPNTVQIALHGEDGNIQYEKVDWHSNWRDITI